jgi:hypothetical protein
LKTNACTLIVCAVLLAQVLLESPVGPPARESREQRERHGNKVHEQLHLLGGVGGGHLV